MVPIGSASFKCWRKRIKPLRPWLIGLRIPEIISELADIVPFIYLCCKLSVVEQSWATQPGDPKAVIVKDGDDRFVARANEVKLVKETHCLGQAFSSIPCIMTCKEKLLAQPSTPYGLPFHRITYRSLAYSLSDSLDLRDYSSEDDKEKKGLGGLRSCSNTSVTRTTEEKPSNADNGVVVEKQDICAAISQWIPTQNASGESLNGLTGVETDAHLDTLCTHADPLSLYDVSAQSNGAPHRGENNRGSQLTSGDIVSGTEGELNHPKQISCTPPENVFSNSDVPLLSGGNSPHLKSPGARAPPDLNSDRLCLLENLADVPAAVQSTDRSSFLHWLGAQEATVEICYLEETVHAIDELQGIVPARPFSEHFINFAFSD
ncbi:unnamed protein product [Taenia asiatica]|uniref:Uncharacterized protein n=1 Tax=Taenia asiatica TaxID=60517 RepID=A0A0R3WCR7_TAEAS|nr:unnamed protein product [Taenia asiatica]